MTNDKLPLDLIKNIWAEAERYAEEKVKAVNEEHFNVYNAHIAGATAWAPWFVKHNAIESELHGVRAENDRLKKSNKELQAQAQRMADALEWIKTYGPVDERTVKFINKALQQFKDGGKEVECPKCKRMVKEGWACQECSTKV